MDEARLRPGIWVKAQLRLCDRAGIALTVLRRGDAHAGSVLLKIVGADGAVDVLAQTTASDGGRAWMRPLGAGPLKEGDADSYLARQGDFDPDVWVLEIVDPRGAYQVDGRVIGDE